MRAPVLGGWWGLGGETGPHGLSETRNASGRLIQPRPVISVPIAAESAVSQTRASKRRNTRMNRRRGDLDRVIDNQAGE